MAYVAIADRDHEQHLHDPQTFIEKYVWSQDHKVIAIQYGGTAIAMGVTKPAIANSQILSFPTAVPRRISRSSSARLPV